ncbi:hypothetical protein GCM10009096_32920 [Parasphingorhabdus litoris]|uniref:Rap1a immunity protein domain-containing protein n=1 Tax=Parasphingorhabdus litoris TaxID=394733 RepID=A0ABN1B021_9SPHN|nr:hypothetical protein [Parasphingorhabdus litoris]
MKQSISLVASTIMLSIAVPASAMPVSEFLPKADKLMKAGMGAMFSKNRKPVMAEMEKVTNGYRADIKAARAAGKTPSSCPPPKGKGKLNGKEFIAHLKTIPVAQRNMEVKTAFHGFMKKKYPC